MLENHSENFIFVKRIAAYSSSLHLLHDFIYLLFDFIKVVWNSFFILHIVLLQFLECFILSNFFQNSLYEIGKGLCKKYFPHWREKLDLWFQHERNKVLFEVVKVVYKIIIIEYKRTQKAYSSHCFLL